MKATGSSSCIERRVLSLALVAGLPSFSLAAPINYGDFPGTNVVYQQVTEDSNSAGDAPPLFGTPSVTGDSIDFNPVGFSAAVGSAGGSDMTDGNLKFGLVAKPGQYLQSVTISEAGDTSLVGAPGSTAITSVTTNIFFDIQDVDGVPLSAAINVAGVMTIGPSGGSYQLGVDGPFPLYNTGWSGSYTLNLGPVLTANNIPFQFGVTRLSVNLDNTLSAVTAGGASALIAKKDADGVTITAEVPEPASLALVALGFVAAGRRRR